MARGYGGGIGGKPGGPSAASTRFRCKVGGEWKPLEAFSNNQQKTIQVRLDAGTRVDAAHCGMTCREHSSSMTNSICCELCGLKKDRSQFSKSSLKNEVYKCVNCVAWTETQEPDVTPAPLPTGHVSAEEEGQGIWKDASMYSGEFFAEDALPKAPVTALSSLGLNDEEQEKIGPDFDINSVIRQVASASMSTAGKSTDSRGTNTSQLPPHLRSFSETTSVVSETDGADSASITSQSSNFGPQSRGTAQLPAHLRAKAPGCSPSPAGSTMTGPQSPATGSQIQQSSSSVAKSISTATTAWEERKANNAVYNAWDTSGARHQRVRTPSTTGSSADSASLIDFEEDEPAGTTTRREAKSFTPVQPQRGRKNGWHKAPRLSTTELLEFGNETSDKAQHIDGEIDHQRRYNFLSSDDFFD